MIDIIYFDGSTIKKGTLENLNKIRKKYPVWVDIIGFSKEETHEIGKIFNLHPVTTDDLHKSRVRTKVEEFKDYIICIFHGLSVRKKVTFYEQDFILGKKFIITNHKREIEYYEDLKKDKERLPMFFKRGCDFLLSNFINELIEEYFPIISKIDEEIEALEELAVTKPSRDILTRIFKIKKLIVAIKKITYSQRDKIADLWKEEFDLIEEKTMPYIRDVYDHSIRVYDLIDSSRESIANCYDVYMSSITNSTNQVMKLLSIITTIMLPLGIITGMYGTNFHVLPGAESPIGFWIMVLSMLLIVLIMVYFFKRKGWF